MRKFFTFFVILASLSFTTVAQNRCGAMDNLEQTRQENPKAYQNYLNALEIAKNWEANPLNQQRMGSDTIVIPVVVHVIYKTASQNISDQQINEQIEVLNKDFARLNSDASNTPARFQSVASGAKIKFCLANRDPSGNPTTGIERKQTTTTSFARGNTSMKFTAQNGLDAWPRTKYLNLWSCNLGDGILGFATFPGESASLDGVVILSSVFGKTGASAPYNLGRTASHEVGHWLGLYHIWGDDGNGSDGSCSGTNTSQCNGTDGISDTPNQCGATYGCVSGVQKDICNNTVNGFMYMNYMDYVNDNCMNMFTVGQVTKINAILSTSRSAILTSDGCSGETVTTEDAQPIQILVPVGNSCNTIFAPSARFRNNGSTIITTLQFTFGTVGNADSLTYNYNGSIAPGSTIDITSSNLFTRPAGAYTFFVRVKNVNGTPDDNLSNNYLTGAFTIGNITSGVIPFFDGFEANNFPVNYTLNASNSDSTWEVTNSAKKTGSYSLYINYYDYSARGAKDEFILPSFNLSSVNNPILVFDRSYAQYTSASSGAFSDTLEILVENGCGNGFQSVYKKFGTALQTTAATQSSFVPTSSGQWKSDTVNLSSFAGTFVNIKIRGINRFANNLYLDNINVKSNPTTRINQNLLEENRFSVFPNPNNGNFYLQYIGQENAAIEIRIYDLTGKLLQQLNQDATIGVNTIPLDLGKKYTGHLLIQLNDGKNIGVRKVFVQQ